MYQKQSRWLLYDIDMILIALLYYENYFVQAYQRGIRLSWPLTYWRVLVVTEVAEYSFVAVVAGDEDLHLAPFSSYEKLAGLLHCCYWHSLPTF